MLNRFLLAFALIASALGYTWWSRHQLEKQLAKAPDESLLASLPAAVFQRLDTSVIEREELLALSAQAVLVHFWATWCGPCEAELPELLRFIEKLPQDVSLALVAVNDDVPKIQKFIQQRPAVEQKKIVWLLDNQQVHRTAFGTTKLPETYLFRVDGKLLRKFVGPQEWENPHFIDMFRSLLP